jgi:hypothetical protein
MPEQRFPTQAEFWRRLDKRHVEPDLRDELHARAERNDGAVQRVGRHSTVVAFVEQLLPGSAVPASVIAQFLDEHFDEPMGRSDEKAGVMQRAELAKAGFKQLDEAAGGDFSSISPERQQELLTQAERGQLKGPPGFDSATWFKRLRDLALLGYGADPRGMVQMGYPGPAYQPGHVWLDYGEVQSRANRKPGYLEL